MRNLYSGFLLGTLLLCSGLFYGLALTQSDRKFQQDSGSLNGTWRLVAVNQFDGSGRPLPVAASSLQSLKIVANRHYSRVVTNSDGQIVSTTAGLIELTDGRFFEYQGFKPNSRTQQAYDWRLAQGQLIQRKHERDLITEEVWQLID